MNVIGLKRNTNIKSDYTELKLYQVYLNSAQKFPEQKLHRIEC